MKTSRILQVSENFLRINPVSKMSLGIYRKRKMLLYVFWASQQEIGLKYLGTDNVIIFFNEICPNELNSANLDAFVSKIFKAFPYNFG